MASDFLDDDDDDLFFAEEGEEEISLLPPWKVLIVDDEPGIHQVTKFAIQELVFEDRPLEFLHAYNGLEANEMVANTPDIALILLDVVMESQTAGLDVAKHVRDVINNHLTRIILRTGQPGYAPEAEIILDYDINDYKNKTELSKDKLCTTVIAALRGYGELVRTESYRRALSKIMDYSEQLLTVTTFDQFYDRLCTKLSSLLPLGKLHNPQQVHYALLNCANGTNEMLRQSGNIDNFEDWFDKFNELAPEDLGGANMYDKSLAILPIHDNKSTHQLFLAIDNNEVIDKLEQQLLDIFAHYIEIASHNLSLQLSLSSLNTELEGKVEQRTKELNIEKQKAEHASLAKSQFLANMSHEIRTPMNAILGFTQLLIRASDTSASQKDTLLKVDKAGNHLMDIINDVLEISKIEAGAMEIKLSSFDLGALLEDVGQMFSFRCEQKALEWQIYNNISNEIPVIGDQGKLRQIMINLLGNAVKFTDKGFVKLTLSQPQPHFYNIQVEDSGPGMCEEELASLFTNFAQGKAGVNKGGTGLGLAISFKQVKLMESKIEVESTVNQGSTFQFTVQLEPSSELCLKSQETQLESVQLKEGNTLRTLVVDDIEANRDVLGRLLAETKVDIDYACDGKEAVDMIQNTAYDIVFMDILMPVMRGDEAIHIIRHKIDQSNLFCVAISAFSLAHEVEYYIDIGFNEFIPKPFLFSDIYNCLDKFSPGKFEKVLAQEEQTEQEDNDICLSDHALTRHLHEDLLMAAELNRLSYIKEFIDKHITTDPSNKTLGRYLHQFVDNYDLDGFIMALKEVGYVE
jgi:signal transduction histidine kinase/CheY-like chemotaxis protein